MELEPGPLTLIDANAVLPAPRVRSTFEELFAQFIADAGGAAVGLELAERAIGDASSPAPFEAVAGATIDPAEEQLGGSRFALETLNPEDLLVESRGHVAVTEAQIRDYDDQADEEPPEIDEWNPDDNPRPPERGPIPA